jgi:hypothetical protein
LVGGSRPDSKTHPNPLYNPLPLMREGNVKLAAKVLGKELMNLPFDQHQRYRIVADAIEQLREDSGPLQILDVGGGEGIMLNFLSEDRVTALDRSDAEWGPGFVKGDKISLPFEDETFDFVVSVDVYEHIQPEARDKFLSELRRTARRGVLLAAPFDSAVVRDAERTANEFHRAMHLQENVWLREHVENGLPSLDDAKRFFEEHDATIFVLPNGYIPHWLAMMCLTFYSSTLEGELSDVSKRVNAFYNEFMYELDNREPCYRFLLVSLREAPNVDLNGLTSYPDSGHASQSLTLFGTLSAMLPLASRLAQKEAGLARKETQVNDLSYRLAERVGAENARQEYIENLEQATVDLRKQSTNLRRQLTNVVQQRDELKQQLEGLTSARSWRLLTTLRKAKLRVGRLFGSG